MKHDPKTGAPIPDCTWQEGGIPFSFWVVSDWARIMVFYTIHDPVCTKVHWPSRAWLLNGLAPASQVFAIELQRYGYKQTGIGGTTVGNALLEQVARVVTPRSGRLDALVRSIPKTPVEGGNLEADWNQVGMEDLAILNRAAPGWEASPSAPDGVVAIVTGPYPDRDGPRGPKVKELS